MIPPLFSRIPSPLLTPLAGPYSPIYWDILARCYELEFEGEPTAILKPVAIQIAEEVLVASPLWQERRDEILIGEDAAAHTDVQSDAGSGGTEPSNEADQVRAVARRLLARLEQSGWFAFEYRSTLGLVLSFYPYAARILEALVRIARDEQPVFQGYAHSIASLLRSDNFALRPGISVREAKRHTFELVRELKILNRNIYAFTQRLLDEVTSAAGVLTEGLDRYRHAIQANYHRLKTIDNLYKWRGEVLLRLEDIERDESALDTAARWYGEQLGVDQVTARAALAEDLRLIRAQFETLPAVTDDIDARNARFSGVALRKIMYLLRQDRRTEGQLQLIVDSLAHDTAPEIDLDVYRCDLLGERFLYPPPARRQRAEPQPLRRPKPADEQRVRNEAAARLRRPFARARIASYVEELLAGRDSVPLREASFDDDSDYVRAIYITAYGLEPGGPFRFRHDPEAAPATKGPYRFPDAHLERRRRRSRS